MLRSGISTVSGELGEIPGGCSTELFPRRLRALFAWDVLFPQTASVIFFNARDSGHLSRSAEAEALAMVRVEVLISLALLLTSRARILSFLETSMVVRCCSLYQQTLRPWLACKSEALNSCDFQWARALSIWSMRANLRCSESSFRTCWVSATSVSSWRAAKMSSHSFFRSVIVLGPISCSYCFSAAGITLSGRNPKREVQWKLSLLPEWKAKATHSTVLQMYLPQQKQFKELAYGSKI